MIIFLFNFLYVTLSTGRYRSVVGSDYFGVVTGKRSRFFGLRHHASVTPEQMIDEWRLAPAIHGTNVLDAFALDCRDWELVGGKAYNDRKLEHHLWEKRYILLLLMRRGNQTRKWPVEVRRALGNVRHHVRLSSALW
jgi:hypothetical protein